MNNGEIRVDDREVIKALANLSFKKMNKAYKTGMQKSLDPILKQTKQNLRASGIRHVNKPYIGKNGKKYKSMLQGVKTSVYMGDTEDSWGKVHIMSEFRLKFFEKGTNERHTRKGWKRGSIAPKWFFRNAVNQKGKEATDNLDDNIRKSILQAWNKK